MHADGSPGSGAEFPFPADRSSTEAATSMRGAGSASRLTATAPWRHCPGDAPPLGGNLQRKLEEDYVVAEIMAPREAGPLELLPQPPEAGDVSFSPRHQSIKTNESGLSMIL